MASSKITLIGFNNWLSAENDTLFANLLLPEGIDKDTLSNNILLRGGEFEVLFSDPYTMKEAIGVWSSKWNWTFAKWIKAINIEYNPLENYDRMESWEESENGTNTNSNVGKTTDNGKSTGNIENSVSAYDTSSFSPHDKSESVNTTNAETNITANNNGSYNNDSTKTGRAHGNIGVITSQQMLQSELDVAMFNLYDQITDIFLREFVIPIY